MRFSDCLKKILAKYIIEESDGLGSFNLYEANVMSVRVLGISQDCVVLNLKNYKNRMFTSGAWRKLCDYIVIDCSEHSTRVMLVELKRSLSEPTLDDASEQLRRSLPTLEYLKGICEIEDCDSNSEMNIKYLILAKRLAYRIDKQPVRVTSRHRRREYSGIEIWHLQVNEEEQFEILWEGCK